MTQSAGRKSPYMLQQEDWTDKATDFQQSGTSKTSLSTRLCSLSLLTHWTASRHQPARSRALFRSRRSWNVISRRRPQLHHERAVRLNPSKHNAMQKPASKPEDLRARRNKIDGLYNQLEECLHELSSPSCQRREHSAPTWYVFKCLAGITIKQRISHAKCHFLCTSLLDRLYRGSHILLISS